MRATCFADLLDARVGAPPPIERSMHIETRPLDGAALPWLHGAAAFRPTAPAARERPPAAPAVPAGRPARAARALTPDERSALDSLGRAAGQPLDARFGRDDLKRAFRAAARRLHPDAHPHATSGERQMLAQRFATARAAYLVLLRLD